MQWGQFIFSWFRGEGQRIYQSPNVEKMLSEESLQSLYNLGKYPREHNIQTNKFETEQVVAYTVLKPVLDNHGRTSMWNNTIIIRYDDIFSDYLAKVLPFFVPPTTEPLKKLKPIEVT